MTITIGDKRINMKDAMELAKACKQFSPAIAEALAADDQETRRTLAGIQALREALANADRVTA